MPIARLSLFALTVAAVVATAGPAAATLNGTVNQQQAEIACSGTLENAGTMMKLADNDPDGKMPAATKDFEDFANRCPSPRYVNAGRGWASFAKAIVAHKSGGDWAAPLDDAIGRLTTCVSNFSDSSLGGKCKTSLANATAFKQTWAAAPATHSP